MKISDDYFSTKGVDKFFLFDCQRDSCSMAKAYAPTATAEEVPSVVTPTPMRLLGSYHTSISLKGTLTIFPVLAVKRFKSQESIKLKASVSMRGMVLPFTLYGSSCG